MTAASPARPAAALPESARRLRLAVVASHPVQYQAPWYRALASLVDLRVFFAHRAGPADQARAGFDVAFDWDVPLLEGFEFEWLENTAADAGVDHFFGCNTPGVGQALERGRFDAVVVNGWHLLTYWQTIRAARRAATPVMVRGDSQLATARSLLRRGAKRLLYPRVLRSFDACLVVGRRNADYYRHYGVPSERLFSSPHCVDNAFFARHAAIARQDRAGLRRELGLPSDAIVFAFVGKLIEKKRPLDFLMALDAVAREHPTTHGLVIGDGALRARLEAHRSRHRTACAFAGFVNQSGMARVYAAADALVLPSTAGETWGMVVNEAMACGVPAIVSDQVGCAPDLIVESETGLTYPCGDVAALAQRMARVAADAELRAAMGRRAARHVARLSPEAAADGVIRALESVGCLRDRYPGLEPDHAIDVAS